MDVNKTIMNISQSNITLSELYRVFSTDTISSLEHRTGVLLHFTLSTSEHSECDQCSNIREEYIQSSGGSILHDTGNEILAEWSEENVPLKESIFQACLGAFSILGLCCKVFQERAYYKIAMSAGRFTRVTLPSSDYKNQTCVVFGPAVDDLMSTMEQVKFRRITQQALSECNFGMSAELTQLCDSLKLLTVKPTNDKQSFMIIRASKRQRPTEIDLHCGEFCLREHKRRAYLCTTTDRERIINEYMMHTALNKDKKNLEDLLERWPVGIMFMNIRFLQTQTDKNQRHQDIEKIVSEQITRCCGKICNTSFFKEGCIFVAAVGLPDDNRRDIADHILEAANRIHETCLREVKNICISLGVALGRVLYEIDMSKWEYMEWEYKVYGSLVQNAAKMTIDNPGIVSCDMATKLYSRLPLSTLMPESTISTYDGVHYVEEIRQLVKDEAAATCSDVEGRRLALAHLQTMIRPEQMVLKYAAIIGNTFSIEMLQSIIPPHINTSHLINTLNSLVSAGIIQCAFKKSSSEPCGCENKNRDLTEVSTQPMWQCQQMTFCNMDEMQTFQKLIEKSEKLSRLIHTKCAKYMETKAYRCGKCEKKNFLVRHKASTDINNAHVREIYNTIRPYEVFQSPGGPFQYTSLPSTEQGNETQNFLSKVKSMVTETAGSCECAQLVESVLLSRMRHWKCSGHLEKTYAYLLEIAAAYVYLGNDARALECLTEARSILENSFGLDEYSSEHAFVHRLTGEILFRAGKLLEAKESFKKALKLLDCNLPHNTVTKNLRRVIEKIKKAIPRDRCFEMPEKEKLGRMQESINCLSFLWQIYNSCGKPKSASLAITMEINLAIRSADPFKILYTAIDYLKYSQFKDKESECRHLEAFLCKACASLSDHPEGQKLIAHLTQTLTIVKLCTGDLEKSIECNSLAQKLSQVLHSSTFDVRSKAVLYLPLLHSHRYWESVQQIKALEKLGKEMASSVAQGWFYAACMNTLLYAGFAFRPFNECLAFLERSRSDKNLSADKSLMLHLYSAVALWYARLEDWDRFAVFFSEANNVYAQISNTIQSISGVVMLLECRVVHLRKDLVEYSSQRQLTNIQAHELCLAITQRFGKNHILFPRMLHLNAFMDKLSASIHEERYLIQVALELCRKQGNLLDEAWIRQSQADWSPTYRNTYVRWCTVVQKIPSWNDTTELQPEELLKYRFHLRKWEEATWHQRSPSPLFIFPSIY